MLPTFAGRNLQANAPDASLLRVICGVLDAVLPLRADEIGYLMQITRGELVRAGYRLHGRAAIDPWHYIADRHQGKTVLTPLARQILLVPADERANATIRSTIKHWRSHHGCH